ncbi:hypothetical protein D3C73_764140 [compost metagenome]
MPGRILEIDGVAQAIGISIDATALERTPAVRAAKSHQARVVGPVAPSEQITAGRRVQPLTLESLQTAQPARGGTITEGGVRQKRLVRRSQAPERCALPVRQEQDDLVTLPLGQHHPAIVQQTAPLPDLDFAAQCPLVIEEPEQRVSPGGHRMQLIFGIELIMRAVATTPHMLEPTQSVVFKRTTLIIIKQIAVGVIFECHVPR